jgi:hypothetical protein
MKRSLVLGMAITMAAVAQSDPWAPLRAFEGKWKGLASGEPGKGISTREYCFELGGRFLSARNTLQWEF